MLGYDNKVVKIYKCFFILVILTWELFKIKSIWSFYCCKIKVFVFWAFTKFHNGNTVLPEFFIFIKFSNSI